MKFELKCQSLYYVLQVYKEANFRLQMSSAFDDEGQFDWLRKLQEHVTMVYQESSLLVSDNEKNQVSRLSLFTSSSVTLTSRMSRITKGNDMMFTVFYKLMSSFSNDSSGWFALLFSCKLITASLGSHLTISTIIRGFSSALMIASEEISINESFERNSHQLLKLSWDDLTNILCVIKTSLSTRHVLQLSQLQIESISVNLLTAFLSSIDDDKQKCSIIYRQSAGPPIDNMIVLENSLLMDIPIPPALQHPGTDGRGKRISSRRYEDLIVAIFENSLEIPESPNFRFEINDHCRNSDEKISPHREATSIKSLEYQFMEDVAEIFVASKVTLVACQRRIHPYLIRVLQRSGIICLPRLSIRFCGALQRMSGARQLLSFPISRSRAPIQPQSLGYLASLQFRVIYGRKYVMACAKMDNADADSYNGFNSYEQMRLTHLLDSSSADEIQSRKSPMSTVVVTAPSEIQCGELQIALENVAADLTTLLNHPYVLPGAGLWQAYTAKRIKERLLASVPSSSGTSNSPEKFSIGGKEEIKRAVEIFVKCLDDSSQIIGGLVDSSSSIRDENGGDLSFTLPDSKTRRDIVDILFHNPVKNCTVRSSPCINDSDDERGIYSDKIFLIADALEPLLPSLNALQLAVDTAICVLDLDGAMISHPIEVTKNYS